MEGDFIRYFMSLSKNLDNKSPHGSYYTFLWFIQLKHKMLDLKPFDLSKKDISCFKYINLIPKCAVYIIVYIG